MPKKENEMSHGDSEEEKLVEEIRKERCKGCLFLRSLDKAIDGKCGASIERCRDGIRRDIDRIGKAYADGLPLPGEEARITSDVEGPIINAIKGYTYIALSPFSWDPLGTGTGKEEEPSFIAEIH